MLDRSADHRHQDFDGAEVDSGIERIPVDDNQVRRHSRLQNTSPAFLPHSIGPAIDIAADRLSPGYRFRRTERFALVSSTIQRVRHANPGREVTGRRIRTANEWN